eukprot:2557954-Pleurochrysis_carterae.AAC.4
MCKQRQYWPDGEVARAQPPCPKELLSGHSRRAPAQLSAYSLRPSSAAGALASSDSGDAGARAHTDPARPRTMRGT